MRSSAKQGTLGRLFLLCALSLLSSWNPLLANDASREFLEVKTDPAGGVIATARVLFPARPEIIHSLLTDYPRWPELFEVPMRVADLHIRQDVVTTDLRIEHALLPGERRLVTESRTTANQGIVTDLVGGDFKRYHRTWMLSPINEGKETIADFELKVAIESIVPDWLVALATRRELEAHFRIVKEKARVRAAKSEK
ncbi:MAG TPA: SRPBCC family protein [Nitrospira sp.]|nr:SRPBCC family protein [Nitrospira sp.]